MDEYRRPTTVLATPVLSVRVARVVDAPVVMLTGELDLRTVDALGAALEPLAGRVVVDLSGVSFLDCAGIGCLVAARRRLLAAGGDLHLRSPQQWVRRVLELLGFEAWIIDRRPVA